MQTNEIRLAKCLIGEVDVNIPSFDSVKRLVRTIFKNSSSLSVSNPNNFVTITNSSFLDLSRVELDILGLDIISDCLNTFNKSESYIHAVTTRLTISLCKHNPKQLYVSVHGVDHNNDGHYFWFYIDREQK